MRGHTLNYDIESVIKKIGVNYALEGGAKRAGGVSSLEEATKNDLCFCSLDGKQAASSISESKAAIILCKFSLHGSVHPRKLQSLIFVDNPGLTFIRIVNFKKKKEANASAISPHALISRTSKIGSNCSIGDFTIIGKNCSIGDNTVIHDRVSLLRDCRIGRNCTIQSGVTIGFDGFAYERMQNGKLERFPHLKGVIIGDDVDICPNCLIGRGSLSDTVIGDGTKLDGQVYVAHNAKIGKNCLLAAGTIVGGTAKIGDQCWTGLHCSIKQKVRIGNNVIVGAGAVVLHDIADGDIVAGVPAKSIKEKVTTDKVFMMAGQKR
ncbi:MAG: UDP-3-O-(3-hydroxymyristoyl)glucosamine N-acyltransferase [Nitrososphaera sp.]|uniref:UDP-3-O-(3-hydroxymyristoyl)glucosamine N-acyltransferase n=1 Tax=Nitrososphaera sp. TaxID=1971748 RepID=UPI003D6E3742